MIKSKKALLMFPRNTLICYDLHIIDIYNKCRDLLPEEPRNTFKDKLFQAINGNPLESPLHELIETDNGELKLVNIKDKSNCSYNDYNNFIYSKGIFTTMEVYKWLIQQGLKDLVHLTKLNHRNITVSHPLDQYNNFIVYDNTYWNELSILKSLYGESTQYINRDELADWVNKNVDTNDPENIGSLELTLVSDAFDIDKELSYEIFEKLREKSKYVKLELRICCLNRENLRRYNVEKNDKKNTFGSKRLDCCSVGLFKLWDNKFM